MQQLLMVFSERQTETVASISPVPIPNAGLAASSPREHGRPEQRFVDLREKVGKHFEEFHAQLQAERK
jgi:hypothetical protein